MESILYRQGIRTGEVRTGLSEYRPVCKAIKRTPWPGDPDARPDPGQSRRLRNNLRKTIDSTNYNERFLVKGSSVFSLIYSGSLTPKQIINLLHISDPGIGRKPSIKFSNILQCLVRLQVFRVPCFDPMIDLNRIADFLPGILSFQFQSEILQHILVQDRLFRINGRNHLGRKGSFHISGFHVQGTDHIRE